METMLAEIAAGVLVNVITATGRWIASSAMAARGGGKAARRDADIAVWFGTYELVGAEGFPELPGIPADDAGAWLRRNDVHAVLHELLAVRITSAAEADVERLRGALRRTTWDQFSARAMSAVARRVERRDAGNIGAPDPGGSDVRILSRRSADKVADLVFDWADGEICELVARFEARDPQRWRAARQDAFGARVVAVLNAIERHMSALEGEDGDDTAWAERYRRQAMLAYGSIEPPDFARRRKVPIADLYVPPDIIEPGAARDADGNPRTIGFDALAGCGTARPGGGALAGRIDRTVLLGDPGGGKSTASRVLAHRWAGDPAARVPFLVVLREFAGGDGPNRSVVEHIEERLNAFHQCAAPAGAVERLLLSGEAAVIFDGLDELIDTGRRIEVTRVVEQFCARFPLAPVLVTSRLVGYDEARLDEAVFEAYRIAGFCTDKTAAYVRNWFALEDDTDADSVADAFIRESAQVTDLRSNPLMLSLMCILYRGEGSLPRNRPGVYAECARLLFDKWDTRRGIHIDLQARNLIEPALRHIAYWLFTRDGSPEVTERELVAHVADLLYERGFEQRHDAEAAAGEFVRFCRGRAWILGDAGTTARGEPLYTFTHRTFLEYFAAAYLASVHDTPEKLARALAPHVAKGEWDVVGQLAVQIKDAATDRGAERVLTALLDDKRRTSEDARMHLVAFAARCLDVAEVPPALVRTIAHRAFDQLAPHANHAMSYLPLWREGVGRLIGDVLHERTARLVASDDSADRTLGLRFSAYATFFAASNANSAYWHRLERELIARHRDVLVEAARTDDPIWMRLVDRGVITTAEALRLHGNDIGILFRGAEVPFIDRQWLPYAEQVLVELAADPGVYVATFQDPDPDAAVDRCRALGGAFLTMPEPPWPIHNDAALAVAARLQGRDLRLTPPADATGYLGAAVLLAILIELSAKRDLVRSRLAPRGTDELDAYLAGRPGVTRLPVTSRFQVLFDRWARGEFRFVQWRYGDQPE